MKIILEKSTAHAFLFILLNAVMMFASGCSGGNAPGMVTVDGTVSFNGSPLPEGKVVFEPAEGEDSRPFAASIRDGKFEIETTPGKKTVRITASRLETPKGMSTKERGAMEVGGANTVPVQYIPDRYNRNSELSVEVNGDGNNDVSLDLEGK